MNAEGLHRGKRKGSIEEVAYTHAHHLTSLEVLPKTTPKDGSSIAQKCFHTFSFKRLVPLFACAELSWRLRSLNARYF